MDLVDEFIPLIYLSPPSLYQNSPHQHLSIFFFKKVYNAKTVYIPSDLTFSTVYNSNFPLSQSNLKILTEFKNFFTIQSNQNGPYQANRKKIHRRKSSP